MAPHDAEVDPNPAEAQVYEHSIDATRQRYARLAGLMYLVVMALFIAGESVIGSIKGLGDFATVAERVGAAEHLYRVALACTAVGAVAIVVLTFALYVVLEPVNRRLAQLALYARIGEAFIVGAVIVWGVAALRLYLSARTTGTFTSEQLDTLVSVTTAAYGSGVQVWLMFFSLGSGLFFYLFHQSRLIPRALAAFGVFASIVVVFVSLGILVFPEHAGTIQFGWGPIFIAEITTGCWLLFAGLRAEKAGAS